MASDGSRPRVFHADLHNFRGFAILTIVLSHVFGALPAIARQISPPTNTGQLVFNLNQVAWHDSTIYFALISGLLFSSVLSARGWGRFFRNKAANVILPYAVMSLVFSLVWYFPTPLGDGLTVLYEGPTALAERYASNLVFGTTNLTYWYIPVLACLFALTPLLFWLARIFPVGLVVVVLLPLVVSRTGTDVSVQSVVYFVGVYAVGIYAGLDYEKSAAFLVRHVGLLAIVAAAATAALIVSYEQGLDFVGPVSVRESVFYVQKLALAGVVLVLLRRHHAQLPALLGQFATVAFAIYFIHLIFLLPLVDVALALSPPPLSGTAILLLGVPVFSVVALLSLASTLAMRRILGRYSRPLTGA